MGSDLLVQSIEASPSAWTDNFTRATGPTIAPRQGSHNHNENFHGALTKKKENRQIRKRQIPVCGEQHRVL